MFAHKHFFSNLIFTRGSQKVIFPIFSLNGGKWRPKSTRISLGISPQFFHIVSIIVPSLVIIHDEIFQDLPVEGIVLLQKPFLELSFDGVIVRKSPVSEIFFSICRTPGSPRGPSRDCKVERVRSRNGFGSRMSPATVRAWEISPYVMTSA
jgi:hypothetical protein